MLASLHFTRRDINPTRIVLLSFGVIIIVGTLLLMLPIASRSGETAGLLTALFTATSSTCVTGLVLVDTWMTWTIFGQIVIFCMIQLGGLGFVTIITLIMLVMHKRISLSQRLLIVSTFNLQDMRGISRMVSLALRGTLLLEGCGAVILAICFMPDYGFLGGIWRGIFHAGSAFCNAGFDLMGSQGAFSSLTGYADQPVVMVVVMALVVIGGLGFLVWDDISQHRSWRKISTYSKLILLATAFLLLFGWIVVLISEWNNPDTLGPMPVWQKIINGLFQSVTLRTAGFNTIDQGAMKPVTHLVSILLMLVGGGGGSTAGGVKVGTICVLLLAVRAGLTGKEEVTIGKRSIVPRRVFDAMTLLFVAVVLFLVGTLFIAVADGVPLVSAAFETASAIGTVGLTTGITPGLSPASRLIIICLMFLGRVGILSVSMAFLTRSRRAQCVKYPTTDIMVG